MFFLRTETADALKRNRFLSVDSLLSYHRHYFPTSLPGIRPSKDLAKDILGLLNERNKLDTPLITDSSKTSAS